VIVLPLAEEVSMDREVGVLIEELHTSECWPILVYDFSCKMKGNMYTEIHQHGSYIILILGPCKEWEKHISHFWQQLYELSLGNNVWHSWNARAKFVVSVISNCTHIENTVSCRLPRSADVTQALTDESRKTINRLGPEGPEETQKPVC